MLAPSRFLRLWLVASAFLAASCRGTPVEALEPTSVFEHFRDLLSIPRCSGNEAAAVAYVRSVAERHGLEVLQDAARNVIVKRPSPGSAAEPVIVQTHLDMVCEKNAESAHDWSKDPITTVLRPDGWLVANETTLGSDNGIGVAMSLALMSMPGSERMPPLEFVFTVEEETGLHGAGALDVSLLSGRRLLNFDSEEFGRVYIGCAGGGPATVRLPVGTARGATSGHRLHLRGLRGGHSGADIHEYRGNAVVLLARTLDELRREMPLELLDFGGGDKGNAIPRESSALLGLEAGQVPEVEQLLQRIERNLWAAYGRMEPGLKLELDVEPSPHGSEVALSSESADRLLDLVLALPNGVMKISHETEGFMVETSNNVARVRRTNVSEFEVLCFARSSIDSELESVHAHIARVSRLAGASVNRGLSFAGWAPNVSQMLLKETVEIFTEAIGETPRLMTIHAGLECGVIGSKMPGLEMVSFGPDIKGAHAPGERVFVDSVQKNWQATRKLLARLAEPLRGHAEL